jgi:hypothetical protein
MICNQTRTKIKEIGFNINAHKVLLFEDTHDLKPKLTAELERFYFQGEED